MNKWKIKITMQAQLEIRGIHSYITNILLVPETAQKQIRRIIDGIKSLEEMPLRLPLFDKEPWHSRGLRKLLVDNFTILFLPNNDINEIAILHIFYSGRNISNIINDI